MDKWHIQEKFKNSNSKEYFMDDLKINIEEFGFY